MTWPNLAASDLEARVRTYLNEATASFYTQAEIWRWLSLGAKDISEKTLCVRRILDAQTSGSVRTVAFNAHKVVHIEYVPSSGSPKMLRKIDPLRIGHFPRKMTSPHYWYEFENSVGIDPVPDATYDLRLFVADLAKMVIMSESAITEGVGATEWTAGSGWTDGDHTGAETNTTYNTTLAASTNYTVEFKVSGIGTGGAVTPKMGTSEGITVTRNGYHAQTLVSSSGAPALLFAALNTVSVSEVSLYESADFADNADQTELHHAYQHLLALYSTYSGLIKDNRQDAAAMLEGIYESEIAYIKQMIVDVIPDGRDAFSEK